MMENKSNTVPAKIVMAVVRTGCERGRAHLWFYCQTCLYLSFAFSVFPTRILCLSFTFFSVFPSHYICLSFMLTFLKKNNGGGGVEGRIYGLTTKPV